MDSFIGNGVDSYIDLGSDLTIFNYIAIVGDITIASFTGSQQSLFTTSFDIGGGPQEYLSVKLNSDGAVRIYSNNTTFQRGVTTSVKLSVGVKYKLVATFDINNIFTLTIDGVVAILTTYFTYTPTASVSTLTTYIGGNIAVSRIFDGEISEVYWSTNPLAVDEATIKQYVTGQEHFTQAAPDALLADWKGGAVQGQVEITPSVPGTRLFKSGLLPKSNLRIPKNSYNMSAGGGVSVSASGSLTVSNIDDFYGFLQENSVYWTYKFCTIWSVSDGTPKLEFKGIISSGAISASTISFTIASRLNRMTKPQNQVLYGKKYQT